MSKETKNIKKSLGFDSVTLANLTNPTNGEIARDDTDGLLKQYDSTKAAWIPFYATNYIGSSSNTSVKNANYTVQSGDNGSIILVNSELGSFDITLPASPADNFKITIKDIRGYAQFDTVYIKVGTVGHTIDIHSSFYSMLKSFQSITMIFNTSNNDWSVLEDSTWVGYNPVARGIFGAGLAAGATYRNEIDYVQIATTGNATDFGDLTVARIAPGGCASATRAMWGGGQTSAPANSNVIDYVTIQTAANAVDFGDLTVARFEVSACSNSIRGLFGGGNNNIVVQSVIDYITIATLGNALNFGSLTVARTQTGSCSSPTRGLWGGGSTGARSNVIDYVTISTLANAIDFGDLSAGKNRITACSSSVRGIWGGGNDGVRVNVIEYVTIATLSNVTDFGDLTVTRDTLAACSSLVRALFAGGSTGSASLVMDYVTIASTGNATNFGNLTLARSDLAGCSNAHGGLI